MNVACFQARLGIEFDQVRLLPLLSLITPRLNTLKSAQHAAHRMPMFYSISTHHALCKSVVSFKVNVYLSNSHLLCVNGCVVLN